MKGLTGENLLRLLEMRLDNIVFRMGFSSSRAQARQLVGHGGVTVNGKRVNISSYLVKVGDKIAIKEKHKQNVFVQQGMKVAGEKGVPAWLSLDKNAVAGAVNKMPERSELSYPVQEQLIVELYSK
jgi:small subunit ribosomal protein S4